MIVPVILCGGSGTRLWPLSRQLYPKQLLCLTGETQSMLQATVSRLRAFENSIAAPMVLCNEEYRFMVAEQLRDLGLKDLRIILEPEGRNTAPAACVASLEALKYDEQSMVLILPADHLVQDARAFAQAVSTGVQLAEQGKLVTFGIVPSKAESGYGYIKQGPRIEEIEEGDGYLVDAFFEKPSPATAEAYLRLRNLCALYRNMSRKWSAVVKKHSVALYAIWILFG